jgi:hypothetical protein
MPRNTRLITHPTQEIPMKKLHHIAGAIAATAALAATAPAFAQSPATGGNAQGDSRAYSTQNQEEGNKNWSWIGLLGLIGLAGLKGRGHHDDNYRRTNSNMPGRA